MDTHDESALKCMTGLVDRPMHTGRRLFSAAAVSIIDSQRVVGRHTAARPVADGCCRKAYSTSGHWVTSEREKASFLLQTSSTS